MVPHCFMDERPVYAYVKGECWHTYVMKGYTHLESGICDHLGCDLADVVVCQEVLGPLPLYLCVIPPIDTIGQGSCLVTEDPKCNLYICH